MSKELDKVNEIQRTRAIYKADGTTVIESSLFNLLVAYAKEALQRLEALDNANPSEALKYLDKIKTRFRDTCLGMYLEDTREFGTIKQALLKAEQDKKKLNEIEKLTYLLYSERRKIGQEYVKWCKENNILFNDETNMITWVLAIKLKEWLK